MQWQHWRHELLRSRKRREYVQRWSLSRNGELLHDARDCNKQMLAYRRCQCMRAGCNREWVHRRKRVRLETSEVTYGTSGDPWANGRSQRLCRPSVILELGRLAAAC